MGRGGAPAVAEWSAFLPAECRDVLLALLIDQLSGQLDDNITKLQFGRMRKDL